MSSINTNTQAMNALSTLRNVNNNLSTTQERIATGLKITSAKDNAAYFSISEKMKGDSGMYSSIEEGLTLTKNSLSAARLGADTFVDLINEFTKQTAFGQAGAMKHEDIQKQLDELVKQLDTVIDQSSFNGESWVDGSRVADVTEVAKVDENGDAVMQSVQDLDVDGNTQDDGAGGILMKDVPVMEEVVKGVVNVVTGISRKEGEFDVTKIKVEGVNLQAIADTLRAIKFDAPVDADGTAITDPADLEEKRVEMLKTANAQLEKATSASTQLGLSEKSIENQQKFLKKVVDTIDTGVGAMVDADMESEAARLQALQVQQQLATQALSIANQAPQNLVSLFR
ncbi:flagellin N-terminal helical domain-containing protein [Falsigemmobacter faecalis]|uniref:Flagellin n=1 Tax=Falsigemmobacter faecalis TaxID=2488730 RepID=A0A3P3DPB4_9RHOB|nr:flagellin [Falsigemmobacter faecalis]RRH75774.1 flagellar protein [Falsigemmobacter faecalis]